MRFTCAIIIPYVLAGGTSIFDYIELEDPSYLQELRAPGPISTIPTPGPFDGLTLDPSLTTRAGLFDGITIDPPITTRTEMFDGITLDPPITTRAGLFDRITIDPPITTRSGLFDGTLDLPITTRADLFDGTLDPPITTKSDLFDGITLDSISTSLTTSASPEEIQSNDTEILEIRSKLRQPGVERSYVGLLTVLLIISGFILLVGLLQLLTLRNIALNALHPARAEEQSCKLEAETLPAHHADDTVVGL